MSSKTRKTIAGVVIIAWVMVLIAAAVVPVIARISDSPYPDTAHFPSPCPPQLNGQPSECDGQSAIPHTSVTLWSTFSAKGVLAAANPILVTCTLDVNRSDFLQYYRGISFFGAEYLNGTSEGVFLPITEVSNYTYRAQGSLQWAAATDVSWFLVPQPRYFTTFLLGPNSNTTSVLLSVSGAQDTIAMQSSESNTRLAVGGLATGVASVLLAYIALQPRVQRRANHRHKEG